MTKLITTIGPACMNMQTLEFFAKHSVEIARMNCSHNTVIWHEESSRIAMKAGLDILIDLPGPKIRLGEVATEQEILNGTQIIIERQKVNQLYPYTQDGLQVFPYEFPVHKYIKNGHRILIDDGKLEVKVISVEASSVVCEVVYGGLVKSRKGMNMPDSSLEVSFLGDRDKEFLNGLIPTIRPKYVAASFVKSVDDMIELETYVNGVLEENSITDYKPLYCAKLEMTDAVSDENLPLIVVKSDLIMIARGDLALETSPTHIKTPFLQEKIKQECKKQNKPFVLATQVMESMITAPVPTRAEMSDLYRAVKIDQANYVMLSGESAVGKYPTNCIQLMHGMIEAVNESVKESNETNTIKINSASKVNNLA